MPKYLPVESIIATLHPVRMPGSIARTAFSPSGGARRRWRRFSANTSTAALSASIFFSTVTSTSHEGARRRLYASSAASEIWRSHSPPRAKAGASFATRSKIPSRAISLSSSSFTQRTPSFCPRLMAKYLCEGIVAIDSENS